MSLGRGSWLLVLCLLLFVGGCRDAEIDYCDRLVVVFLHAEQGDEETRRLADEIASGPDVLGLSVVGHQASYEEFEAFVLEHLEPEEFDGVTPEMLPPSVRVRTASDARTESLVARYEDDPRVRELLHGSGFARDLMSAQEHCFSRRPMERTDAG